MSIKGVCKDCYYSSESLNEELVVCSYMDDIFNKEGNEFLSKQETETAKYFVDLTNFSGDVFKAYAPTTNSEEPELKICVNIDSWCGKFAHKV